MRLVLSLLALFMLTGCFEEEGPIPIRYGRDECEFCRMIISEARFAVEIQEPPAGRIHKFDDIGDAMHWLAKQSFADDPLTRIWVMSHVDGATWLDARAAWYLPGSRSPMDYGFAAYPDELDGAVSFDAMRESVIERGSTTRCDEVPT
ncbi:MAG: hypothetical protein HQL39_01495 [Alphaproteobacteria bacterium]|nr:hypothetical protein [Alphaproteobacteria bacterium]